MHSELYKISRLIFILIFFITSCHHEEDIAPEESLTPYVLSYPSYFPDLTIAQDNPITVEGINLGRKLYYDPILSNNGYSCSSCHNQSESFSLSTVNSLPHINLAWNSNYLWNGKISGRMEDIMLFEVEQFFATDIQKLNQSEAYKKEFKKVYKVSTITSKEVAFALTQFFKTLISCDSKYDKFIQHQANLSLSEIRGFEIFHTEKGDCFHCHSLGLLTDNKFHNIGLDSIFNGLNLGRYNITGNPVDIGLFKTPTLRNIALTPPYMHDGRFNTLEEVVEHYNSKVKFSSTVDPIMTKASKEFGLMLTPQEKADLVAFLNTLTDSTFLNNPNYRMP